MTTATFRHHDSAPAHVVSPLYRQLLQEWVALNAMPTTATTLRRWSRSEPVLAGHRTLGEIVDAIDAAGPELTDALLLALIRLSHSGHQLAGRVVLQTMLPKLARITRTTSPTSSDNAWSEDRRHIVVAEFWDVLATYPIQRRPNRVAANLALDTLQRINGPRTARADVPIDPTTIKDAPSDEHVDELATNELTSASDLVHVITWALERDVIAGPEAALLQAIYTTHRGPHGSYGFEDAARNLGLTPAAVRQRCSRAIRKLTAAVQAELEVGDQEAPRERSWAA